MMRTTSCGGVIVGRGCPDQRWLFRDLSFPPEVMRISRGKRGGTQKVALPEGYLDDLEVATPPCAAAEVADSGG